METAKRKIAIIGASSGQLPICLKAKEMGLEVHCIAWAHNAVCKDVADYFYPISITEKDTIVDLCRYIGIEGVVSNASEQTAEVVSYVAEKLKLNGTPYEKIVQLHDKYGVRQLCDKVEGLSNIRFYKYNGKDLEIYPCVVKPSIGSAKIGVSFAKNIAEFARAIEYTRENSKEDLLVEEFIQGTELSVETISYHGKHFVIQITDKDSSGAPHFVELGHHQPAMLTRAIEEKIRRVVPQLLTEIGYTNGAAHIELKYSNDKIYLIEANLRGGGDEISNTLVQMSTGIDYLRCMIEVALDCLEPPIASISSYAGIYYLCEQTAELLPLFKKAKSYTWCVKWNIYSDKLNESHSNYERNGYLIYNADHKITSNDIE